MTTAHHGEPRLVPPDRRWQTSFLDAVADYQAEGRMVDHAIAGVRDRFDDLPARWERDRQPDTVPAHPAPQTSCWLVEGDRYPGRVSTRHGLNDQLPQWDGHIGHGIRPTKCRKGYGAIALRLALVEAPKRGIERVLVTCDKGNTASRKIIAQRRGFENALRAPCQTGPMLRYRIGTAAPGAPAQTASIIRSPTGERRFSLH